MSGGKSRYPEKRRVWTWRANFWCRQPLAPGTPDDVNGENCDHRQAAKKLAERAAEQPEHRTYTGQRSLLKMSATREFERQRPQEWAENDPRQTEEKSDDPAHDRSENSSPGGAQLF